MGSANGSAINGAPAFVALALRGCRGLLLDATAGVAAKGSGADLIIAPGHKFRLGGGG